MAKEGHTPGPWEYNDPAKFRRGYGKFNEVAVYAPGNAFPWRMAEVSGPDDETAIANARLIAAAPDLLRVAELLVSWLDEEEGAHKLCDVARAALAKATGSPSPASAG